MAELLDRAGLAAGLDSAGVAWRELSDDERGAFAIDGVVPSAICWPASAEEAARALAAADRLGLKVAPRGGGTKVGLGNPPRGCDLILSTERLDQIVDYAPANLTVTVQAGVSLGRLQEHLAAARQFLPIDPPHADWATIGGVLAANANGPHRLGYGSARDLVIGTRAVTTTGKVVKAGGRVVKNVAGYDLNKLYIGSLGTLVVLVEAGFKIAPKPEAQTTVVGRFASLEAAGEASRAVLHSPLLPTALDLFNATAAERLGVAGLPDGRGGYLLAALGTAPGAARLRQRDDFARLFSGAGATSTSEIDDSDGFWTRIGAAPGESLGSGALRTRATVAIADVPAAARLLERTGQTTGAAPAIIARAGTGALYAGWNLPDTMLNGKTTNVAAALAQARRQLQNLGGALIVEECPRGLKDHLDVWGDIGPALAIMRRLKSALDPRDTLNPGRFVGGI
ncbi:MAG TPA: FAD-binding oxidoreductase [Chloroflexota bacterium]|nr:FAD-binding oxidoreductase [Chloroflexota bacterium]